MSLFPEIEPAAARPPAAEAAAPSFHSIPGNISTRKRQSRESAPGRRRVVLPARPLNRRDRTDPDVQAHGAALRDGLKVAAGDAIRAILGSAYAGDQLADGVRELGDETRIVRRRRDRTPYETTHGADLRRWLDQHALAIDSCRTLRAFREAQCGAYEVQPISCHSRVCPDCEQARSAKQIRRATAIMTGVPANRLSYAVLTVRNTARLAAGYDVLDAGYTSLRRRPLFRGGRCRWRRRDGTPGHDCWHPEHPRSRAKTRDGSPNIDGRNCPTFVHPGVAGGARFDEVTYHHDGMTATGGPNGYRRVHRCADGCDGRARPWHPHANLLLDAPFLIQAELADTWRAVTCPDAKHRRAGWCPADCDAGSPMVWIQRVTTGSIREAIKYVTKSADLIENDDPVQLVEFLIATRNRRMVSGFGSFFGVDVVEDDQPEGETVTLLQGIGVFREGKEIERRYELARFCRQCGRDTKTADGCTYELPVPVNRIEARLRNGFLSWRRPPRSAPS